VTAPHLIVVADDLVWATRLEGQGRTLGAVVQRIGGPNHRAALAAAIAAFDPERGDLVAIDTTARSYAPVDLVRSAVEAGGRVLALAQHDDPELRAALTTAGAERVLAYRALFERGHEILAGLLGLPVPPVGSVHEMPGAAGEGGSR
jgi:hypothetical protein